MQSSVAMDAPLGLWHLADDFDDAPTRELVVHRAILSELEDEPDIFAVELSGREAALAALMELAVNDMLDDDDTPTREFVVRRFTPEDFTDDQLAALVALEADDDDIIVDYEDPVWELGPNVDLAAAVRKVLDAIEQTPAPPPSVSPWTLPSIAIDHELEGDRSWTASHWTIVATLVLALELMVFAALL